MSKLLFPAQLIKVESRTDRTYKLTFNTRELKGADASLLLNEIMNEGWLVYSSTSDIEDADIPTEKADPGLGTKTPSARLRGRLFVYYTEVVKGDKNQFSIWYDAELEKIGSKYLERVNE